MVFWDYVDKKCLSLTDAINSCINLYSTGVSLVLRTGRNCRYRDYAMLKIKKTKYIIRSAVETWFICTHML